VNSSIVLGDHQYHQDYQYQHQSSIMAPLFVIVGVPAILSAVAITVGVTNRDAVNVRLMGFFRDLGRVKANKRRMRDNPGAVIVGPGATTLTTWDILLKRDDPLAGFEFESNSDGEKSSASSSSFDASSLPTFTASELEEFGNGLNENPIYLSVFGMVYDVTAGKKFYGPGASYEMFAGKDVTRGLCLGCKTPECLVRSTDGLTENQIDEGKRWLSFFQSHDKYSLVGTMERIDSESWLDELVEDTVVAAAASASAANS